MDTRMVTLNTQPGHVDAVAVFWDDAVVAEITAQAGSRGFFLLADSASDRVIGLSLWDSAADSEAAGLTFISHMAAVGEHLAAPPSPASFHVAASAVGALGH